MATSDDPAVLLASIRDQRANNPLSILTLAEPILAEQSDVHGASGSIQSHEVPLSRQAQAVSHSTNTRAGVGAEASTDGVSSLNLSPHTLSADLSHYRDLVSKLRFSYLEQVTKEKYLRSIVGDPPVLVSHDENLALEDQLVSMKATLKTRKANNDQLVVELETLAAALADRYDFVTDGLADLERLPAEIAALEEQIASVTAEVETKEAEMMDEEEDGDSNGEMEVETASANDDGNVGSTVQRRSKSRRRRSGHDKASNPRMEMSLEDTEAEIERQRQKVREVDEQIAALQDLLPSKMRECEMVEGQLEELEGARNNVTKAAREMQKAREEGGRDLLEEKGRWLKAEKTVLSGLLGIDVAV